MIRIPLLIICCSFFSFCNFKKWYEETEKINSDLSAFFKYDDISTVVRSGTEKENNNVTITFYKYHLADKSYRELDSMANLVRIKVLEISPNLKNIHHMEVRFTKERDTDNLQKYVTFYMGINTVDE